MMVLENGKKIKSKGTYSCLTSVLWRALLKCCEEHLELVATLLYPYLFWNTNERKHFEPLFFIENIHECVLSESFDL